MPLSFCSSLDAELDAESPAAAATPAAATRAVELSVRCTCGAVGFVIPSRAVDAASVVRCHCAHCRRAHGGAFAPFLALPASSFSLLDALGTGSGGAAADPALRGCVSADGRCEVRGDVRRLSCAKCLNRLATLARAPQEHLPGSAKGDGGGSSEAAVLVCLGAVSPAELPKRLARRWQTAYGECVPQRTVAWWHALPVLDRPVPSVLTYQMRGACACGGCAFTARSTAAEMQLSHCYCSICRTPMQRTRTLATRMLGLMLVL
jgi:hypothetical protein